MALSQNRGSCHGPSNQAPVWRSSFDIDDLRAAPGRPLGDGTKKQGQAAIDSIIQALREWADKALKRGWHRYVFKHALMTLEAMLRTYTEWGSGACTPSYDQIADAADCSRATVIRHMKMLRSFKVLDWVRRTEATGNKPDEGPPVKQASNAYFFEISRLPIDAQILLRQILKRRGVRLDSHPDRQGSGAVPGRAQRLAHRVANGMRSFLAGGRGRADISDKIDVAAFIRAEDAFFGDIPPSQWAALRHPDDLKAQAAYNRLLGIDASVEIAPDSPPKDKE